MKETPSAGVRNKRKSDCGGRKDDTYQQGIENRDPEIARPANAMMDRLLPPRTDQLPNCQHEKDATEDA
jgi:hypothetical protein